MEIKSKINRAKIKMVILASAVMWILVFSQIVIDIMCEKKVSIKEAFSIDDEIHVEKYSNEIVSKIDNISSEEIIKKIMEYNQCSDYQLIEHSSSVEATGKVENYIITVTITQITDKKDMYLHYIICNEKGNYREYMSDECYLKSENTMALLEKVGAESIRYTRIDGVIKEELTESVCKKYTQNIFDKIEAEKISEHYDTDYTVYGYSDKLENEVNSGEEKINVHVRFSCNEITQNTEVVVATPLIMD